jgi:uncharacterized damage-inducible protein DinB
MTVAAVPWLQRSFSGAPPEIGVFPMIVERLRGAPTRAEEKARLAPRGALVRAAPHGWSAQVNLGHLGDIEPLWDGRLDDLLRGAATLRVADLTNRPTSEARHDEAPVEELLHRFRTRRLAWVARLDSLSAEEVGRSAFHARLGIRMRTIDLAQFVADHDDHHLARVTALLRAEVRS